MPLYTFTNANGESIERHFKFEERPETVLESGVEYSYTISSPAIVSMVGGYKIPSNLRDRLTQIKKQNPNMKTNAV